jgi:hypothetical protein
MGRIDSREASSLDAGFSHGTLMHRGALRLLLTPDGVLQHLLGLLFLLGRHRNTS